MRFPPFILIREYKFSAFFSTLVFSFTLSNLMELTQEAGTIRNLTVHYNGNWFHINWCTPRDLNIMYFRAELLNTNYRQKFFEDSQETRVHETCFQKNMTLNECTPARMCRLVLEWCSNENCQDPRVVSFERPERLSVSVFTKSGCICLEPGENRTQYLVTYSEDKEPAGTENKKLVEYLKKILVSTYSITTTSNFTECVKLDQSAGHFYAIVVSRKYESLNWEEFSHPFIITGKETVRAEKKREESPPECSKVNSAGTSKLAIMAILIAIIFAIVFCLV